MKYIAPIKTKMVDQVVAYLMWTSAKLNSILVMKLNVKAKTCIIVPNQTNAYGKTGFVMDLCNASMETMKISIFAMKEEALLKEPLLNVPKPKDLDTMWPS